MWFEGFMWSWGDSIFYVWVLLIVWDCGFYRLRIIGGFLCCLKDFGYRGVEERWV